MSNFVVILPNPQQPSGPALRSGDHFDEWWGDDSYKTAHVTLAVSEDTTHAAYLDYVKVSPAAAAESWQKDAPAGDTRMMGSGGSGRTSPVPPPAFSTEFSLSYTVTNEQYGFVAMGTWAVDHKDHEGSVHLRERVDDANATMHPHTTVKDYLHHTGFLADPDLPGPSHACTTTLASNLTQPRWVVPSFAKDVAPTNESNIYQRWRVFHASQRVCVDFFVAVQDTTANRVLPYEIRYYGNCASATIVSPATEVVAQRNQYSSFRFGDQNVTQYTAPAGAPACGATKATAAAAAAAAVAAVVARMAATTPLTPMTRMAVNIGGVLRGDIDAMARWQ